MRISVFVLWLAVFVAGACHGAGVADAVPSFDIAVNCKAEVAETRSFGETLDYCMQEEENSKRQLAGEWDRFARQDKTVCITETSSDGTPSYVELLTCLELAADNEAHAAGGKN